MRIAFRADASIRIGTGHVMRCLTLAEALRNQGHQCVFICRNHQGHLADQIAKKGFEIHRLNAPKQSRLNAKGEAPLAHAEWLGASWQQDAEQTLSAFAGTKFDWLVVDHYALDTHWESKVAPSVSKIMAIDDLADRKHTCHLLLDQNLGRKTEDYDGLVPESCNRLIGPRYALLRPEFSGLREHSLERRHDPKLKRILITLGGVDRDNITAVVLEALAQSQLPREAELDIVMGAAAPGLETIRRQIETLPFQATVNVNVTDMAERMCLADLCIGAAGSTSWERCCLGLPTITVVLAENQKEAATAIAEQGAAFVIEMVSDMQAVLSYLLTGKRATESLSTMSAAGSSLVDGLGCLRVVNKLRIE